MEVCFLLILTFFFSTDTNECLTGESKCDVNAECFNTEGSYKCDCKPGYRGNGFKCRGMMIIRSHLDDVCFYGGFFLQFFFFSSNSFFFSPIFFLTCFRCGMPGRLLWNCSGGKRTRRRVCSASRGDKPCLLHLVLYKTESCSLWGRKQVLWLIVLI